MLDFVFLCFSFLFQVFGDSNLVLEAKRLKARSSIILGGLKNQRGNHIQAIPSFGLKV